MAKLTFCDGEQYRSVSKTPADNSKKAEPRCCDSAFFEWLHAAKINCLWPPHRLFCGRATGTLPAGSWRTGSWRTGSWRSGTRWLRGLWFSLGTLFRGLWFNLGMQFFNMLLQFIVGGHAAIVAGTATAVN
jgi:hypothetical protein